jgi:hypothetical protein
MLSRRRGKNAVEPFGAKRAAWVSPQAAAVLGESFRTEDLGAVRPLERPARGIENPADRCRRVGHQPQQFGRRHRAVRR